MKKFLFAAFCTVTLAGYVAADEFLAIIYKVDGNNISYKKAEAAKGGKGGGGKGGGKGGGFGKATPVGDEIKGAAAANVKVAKSAFDPDTMMLKEEEVKEGLKADNFKTIDSEKGITATLTTDDKGAITKILMKGGGKKKGG